MNEIKLGFIGTNFVSDWMAESVTLSKGIVKHAVYSRTEESGRAFAEKHGIPTVYTDLEAFFSSDIDAVYIASPNFLHYSQSLNAIRHGKHVLVEKPAALNERQFSEMEQAAKENGVILLEAMRPGHDPAMETAREAMGQIGTIRRAVFDFCQYSSRYDKYKAGEILNAFNPALGNAALMDIGVYAMHCCVMLFGEPKGVIARSVILRGGMEGMGSVLLDYGSHQAEVVYSKITESFNPSAITGEDGTVTLGKLSTVESVSLHRRGGGDEVLVENRPENNMIYEIADFVSCVNGEKTADRFNDTTRVTLRIMDEVRRQGGVVFPTEQEERK